MKPSSEKHEQLKTKTLLLDVMETHLPLAEIKKAYPFPVEVANYKKIEKVISDKDTNYAIVQMARFDHDNSVHVVSNAETGLIYKYFSSLTFNYSNPNGMYSVYVYYPFISVKNLEQYVRESNYPNAPAILP